MSKKNTGFMIKYEKSSLWNPGKFLGKFDVYIKIWRPESWNKGVLDSMYKGLDTKKKYVQRAGRRPVYWEHAE